MRLVLGGDPAARSHRVEQLTALQLDANWRLESPTERLVIPISFHTEQSVVKVDRTIVPGLRNAIAERNLYAQAAHPLKP